MRLWSPRAVTGGVCALTDGGPHVPASPGVGRHDSARILTADDDAGSPPSAVWFVTGGSSGFGQEVSRAAVKQGDRVAVTDREPEEIRALAAQHPDQVLAVALDVRDSAAVRDAVDATVARFGRFDVVFNNAGYGHVGAVEELSDDELREQLDVNLFGVINVTRAALPHLRRQRAGHLLQMSSLNGVQGLACGAYYAASKFAIEGFSESLADEVIQLGIKVTIVEPGPHRTRFLNDRSAKWSTPIDDYADTVGKARQMLREMDGNQPGDPARAARAILQVVDSTDPARRLPLGAMALDEIRTTLNARLQELEKTGVVTDYPT